MESQFIGLGRLTAFLTPRLLQQSHAVDDMGLYVVFLQRHRVEVGLKLVLERSRGNVAQGHRLTPLMAACSSACEAAGAPVEWQAFATEQREYVDLIEEIDPGAATFRYPVDTKNQSWSREDSVDLEALENAGSRFQDAIRQLIRALMQNEEVPVGEDEADPTALELQELVHRARYLVRAQGAMMKSLTREVTRLARGKRPRRQNEGTYAALDAAAEISSELADRAEGILELICNQHSVQLPDVPMEAPPPPVPRLDPLSGTRALQEQQAKQIDWIAQESVRMFRPLLRAATDVEKRSRSWSSPAARQLHLDVTRFRSRLGGRPVEVDGDG